MVSAPLVAAQETVKSTLSLAEVPGRLGNTDALADDTDVTIGPATIPLAWGVELDRLSTPTSASPTLTTKPTGNVRFLSI